MRHVWGLGLALALVALPTSSALARVAVIGTTARLTEDSEQGMQTAVLEAVRLALQAFLAGHSISLQHSISGLPADIKALNVGIRRERQLHEFDAGFEKRIGPPRHAQPLA